MPALPYRLSEVSIVPLTVLTVADQTSPLLYDYFRPERWSHIDLVISCGDLSPEYLDFLCTNLNVPVLYVRGNHDARHPRERYEGFTDLHGDIVTVKGLRIAGFEGCMRYNDGGCQYTEREMALRVWRSRLKAARVGTPDIVVTHAPPAGCHDGEDVCHQGFESFRTAIDAWGPSIFLHGHTHAYNGPQQDEMIGGTRVINAFPYGVLEIPLPSEIAARGRKTRPIETTGRVFGALLPTILGDEQHKQHA